MKELNLILARARIAIVASVIDKRRLKDEYLFNDNPYHIALGFCIENTFQFLRRQGQEEKITHFVFERRGAKEDKDLELEFLRIASGNNSMRKKLTNFEIRFVDKKANSAGMQLADLTARPIGLRIIKPAQANRAFEIIEQKLVAGPGRKRINAVQCFLKSERPRIAPRPNADPGKPQSIYLNIIVPVEKSRKETSKGDIIQRVNVRAK